MKPQTKLLLRVARDLRVTFPDLNVKQAIGMATSMIGIVQPRMEEIADELLSEHK